MKIQLITSIALAGILISSCSKVDNLKEETSQVVNFNAGMKKATANNGITTTWSTNDQIGIFMVNNGTTDIYNAMSNRLYQTADGSNFNAATGQEVYFPVSGSKVDFIAYYPYRAGITNLGNFAIDLSSQTDLASNDLLWTKVNNAGVGYDKASATMVPLEFEHKLAKVVILTSAGSGMDESSQEWEDMEVSMSGMNTLADFSLATGVVSNHNSPANIEPFGKTLGSRYEAIVLPETFAAAGDLSVSFSIGTDVFVWKANAGLAFEAGKEYTIDLDIAKIGMVLGNVTIRDWQPESLTGTAN